MLYSESYYPVFLLVLLFVYWVLCRNAGQRIFLAAAASILFLAWRQPEGVLFLIALSMFVYFAGRHLSHSDKSIKIYLFIFVPLLVLGYFKYIAPICVVLFKFPEVFLPLGVSYYTFKHVHYLVECSRKEIEEHSWAEYLAYIFFFPMFMAGPIERFNRFLPEARGTKFRGADISRGAERILLGAFKKLVIADILLRAAMPDHRLLFNEAPDLGWYHIVFIGFLRLLITYVDFSGYTDMVIGTGRLFGIRLMENFNFPLLRPSLPEFWRSWHISLTSWVRDYVYYPLLIATRQTWLAIMATMVTIGVWHGPKFAWLCWGLHHSIGLIILGYFKRKTLASPMWAAIRQQFWWRVLGTFAVWYYVALAYILTFQAGNFKNALGLYIKAVTFGVL